MNYTDWYTVRNERVCICMTPADETGHNQFSCSCSLMGHCCHALSAT